MKKLVILFILMICIFLCCCGKIGMLNPYMDLHEDRDVDFYSIWDSIDFQEDAGRIPGKVNDENFVAYCTTEGSSSLEKKYIICNRDGAVAAYARTFKYGTAKTFSGSVRKELLYEALSGLQVRDIPSSAVDGGTASYALLYYKEDGRVCRCPVNNILETSQR